jgi:hypothetical protein
VLGGLSVVDVSQEAHITSRVHLVSSEAFIHINQKPVWKVVRFPNAPGGTQDYEVRQPEMERCLMVF